MATQTTRQSQARKPKATPAAKPTAKPAADEPKREDGSLTGNLTAEPELRFTPSGLAVANLRVAVNDRYLNEESGQWEDGEPEFYNVTAWRQQGENAVESLHRGDRIVAIGYFTEREYENSEGELVSVREFTARELGPSLLFRTVEINQPIPRRSQAAKRPNQRRQVENVWEDGDEPPF